MSAPVKLTPWFDGKVCPVHKGVYAIKFDVGVGYSYWDGSQWKSRSLLFAYAYFYRKFASRGPVDAWRGLSAEATE